ncbi:uncharacterized protein LOC130570963 [Triplophysa rosa]|nr:uncharacterized protein LOC130570963 [Triplophysa rosa]
MEGVLEAALFLCVFKVSCSSLLFLPAVIRSVSAVSLCCMCLLLFTDLAVTLFLFFVWITESWLILFQVSSDVIALRFLLFLSQVYGVVLMLTPPLIAVELMVHLLRSQENTELDKKDENTLSRTMGFLGCLLVWIVSGIHSSNNWKVGQISTETCLDRGSCLVNCLPGFFMTPTPGMEELSWIVPAMVVLLSLTGGLGLLKTKSAHRFTHSPENTPTQRGGRKGPVGLQLTPIWWPMLDKTANLYVSPSSGTQSKRTPDSCAVYRAGFVYNEERWFCLGNVALCSYQTGFADSFVRQQKLSTSRAPLLQSKTKPLVEIRSPEDCEMEHCDCKKTESVVNETLECQRKQSERENPCLGEEMFRGLVCGVLVCAFPTVFSGNVLLILNLETLVVHTMKLLS